MSDFKFLQNPISKKWVILAPRRAKRPNIAKGVEPVCPFCPGKEKEETEVYRVPLASSFSVSKDESSSLFIDQTDELKPAKLYSENQKQRKDKKYTNWVVRVILNKYPFAPIHEIIIHSQDHHKNFDELPISQVELILQTYRQRYNTYKKKGQVYIFHNRGEQGGESLPHPHTQLTVIPQEVRLDIPRLDPSVLVGYAPRPFNLDPSKKIHEIRQEAMVETNKFYLFCPQTSQWPDEVWLAPKKRGRAFGEITDDELSDFSFVLSRLMQIFDLRHGHEFPCNFYIYPGGDWYLRLIPRLKRLGGFEIGTGIFVNTQKPEETIGFIKEHFHRPDKEKIIREHQAEYHRAA